MASFEFDDKKVKDLLKRFSAKKIKEKVETALEVAGIELSGESAQALKRRTKKGGGSTGRLANSLKGRVSEEGGIPTLRVGSLKAPGKPPLPYARQRDLGGTIKGKPWLAIPIRDNLKKYGHNIVTRSGTMGVSAGDINDSPLKYGFESTFIVKGKSKSPLVVMGVPTGGEDAVPIFALRKSVTQRGYGYLKDTMRDHAHSYVIEALMEEFGEDE